MITARFLEGRRRNELSARELAELEVAVDGVEQYSARRELIHHGEPVHRSMMLVEGFVCRYMDGVDGNRQLVALHVPGDFFDLHGYPLRVLDHDIATLTACRVATFPHATIERLVIDYPNLGRQFWFSTLLDAAMHREWIFRLGRLDARARVAHFFAEIERRLAMVGLSDGKVFDLPLQQADVASACGITPVHANRVLRELREGDIVTFAGGCVSILDLAELHRIGEFDDGYLYPSSR